MKKRDVHCRALPLFRSINVTLKLDKNTTPNTDTLQGRMDLILTLRVVNSSLKFFYVNSVCIISKFCGYNIERVESP